MHLSPSPHPVRSLWHARVLAEAEPVLLARLLQKLVCQGATLHSLTYKIADSIEDVRTLAIVDVHFTADPSRAALLVRQWQTLIPVRSAELRDVHPEMSGIPS